MKNLLIVIGVLLVLCICVLLIGGVWGFLSYGEEITETFAVFEAAATVVSETPVIPVEGTTEPPVAPAEDGAEPPAAGEEGHTLELATEITPGIYDDVLADGQPNWYRFEVAPGQIVGLTLTPGEDVSECLGFLLLDSAQLQIGGEGGLCPGKTGSSTTIMNNGSGGRHYVSLLGQGSYSFELSLQNQNDGNSGGDAGDGFNQATPAQLGTVVTGQIGDYDEEDWYRLEVPPGYVLPLALTAGEDVIDDALAIRLWDADQQEVEFKDVIYAGQAESFTKVMNNSTGGTYYVTIYGQGSYTLDIGGQSQNDGNSGGDAGDEFQQATPVQLGSVVSGQIGDYDQEDWYVVEVPQGHNLSVSFTVLDESFIDTPYVRLNNAEGQEESLLVESPLLGEPETREMLLEAGGPYYFEIGQHNQGWGSYTLEIK